MTVVMTVTWASGDLDEGIRRLLTHYSELITTDLIDIDAREVVVTVTTLPKQNPEDSCPRPTCSAG